MTAPLKKTSQPKDSLVGIYDPRFDELSHHVKRVLSVTAKRALETEYPDVILSLDKILLVNRKPKRYTKHIDPYWRPINYLPTRFLRPEFEYTVKAVPISTWEELCVHYREKRRKQKLVLRETIASGGIIPFTWHLFKGEQVYGWQELMRKNLTDFQNRPPYIYTQRLYSQVANTKPDRRKKEKRVLKALSTHNTPQMAARAAKWFAWRDRKRKQLPIMADYFNWRIRVFREEARSKGIKTSKVRPLKPCLDLNHETYYRTLRDKYIPYEIFNNSFNPFPDYHERRVRYLQKVFPPVPNTL